MNYLPGLALSLNPPALSLLNSKNYKLELPVPSDGHLFSLLNCESFHSSAQRKACLLTVEWSE
jgi:hypothetical protein